MIQASRLPIVLCCAEDSEVALVAVVEALHRDGHAPEVVPGVEADATLLTAATDRVRGPALFVLCQSDGLDRSQVRRLEGLFSARKGPAHRMVTIEVGRRSMAAVVSEVRAAAREVGHGRGGRDDDGSYMRDVVIPTSVAAVPGATVPERGRERGPDRGAAAKGRAAGKPAPSAAIVQAPEGISDEALGLESSDGDETDTEIVDPFELNRRSRSAGPEVQLSTDPAARAALESADWETDPRPSDGVPLAVPDDYPMVGESGEDIEIRGAPGRVSWADSGPVDIERVARRSKADPRAESDDRPLPSASSPIDIGRPTAPPAEPAPPERRGARVFLLLFAGAGMAAVITMAVLHATAPISGGPQDVHQRGVPSGAVTPPEAEPPPTKSVPTPTKVEPTPVPTPDATPAGSTGPQAQDDVAGSSGADAGTGGEAEGASTGSTEEGGSDGASDGPAGDGGEAAAPEEGGPRPRLVPPPPTTGAGAAGEGSLEAAIAEGRIRELGTLLVLNTGPSTVTWDDASSRCTRRKVGGLGNWKLPTKGQLGDLRRAKLLPPGSYWSRSTVGDDEAFVVDAGSGEAAQWLKMEPNGRVVCVRPRPQ